MLFMCEQSYLKLNISKTAVDKEDENSSSTGLMVGVIITSLLVILLASMLLAVALILWRQKKGTQILICMGDCMF